MVIEPSTIIHLLQNVHLDNTYTNTIYFGGHALQYAYFVGKSKYQFNNQMFQRVTKNKCRLNIGVGNVRDCNYMMFNNDTYDKNKWFYAFITNVEYINNEVTEITYELDVMQTFMFDVELPPVCFIDRQHSTTDEVGDNLTVESMNVGEYVLNKVQMIENLTNCYIAVEYLENDTSPITNGQYIDNKYTGSTVRMFNNSIQGMRNLTNLINEYSSKSDNLISMLMFPSVSTGETPIPDSGGTVSNYAKAVKKKYFFTKPTQLDGYTPKNKKLLTYPYCYPSIADGNGSKIDLKYEFFKDSEGAKTTSFGFVTFGTILSPVERSIAPLNYKGSEHNVYDNMSNTDELKYGVNVNEQLTITNFPECSWKNESFYSWKGSYQIVSAMRKLAEPVPVPRVTPSFKDKVNATEIKASNAVLGFMLGGTEIIENAVNEIMGYKPQGNVGSSSSVFANGVNGFYLNRISITKEYAIMIDNYFSMFGYRYNRFDVPNRNKRPHWNYIKTVNLDVHNGAPCEYLNAISNIYNNGITFWNNGDEVGDYSLDNSLVE